MTDTTTGTPLKGLTSDEAVLHRIVDKLASRFAGIFAVETVDRYVFESYTALARTSKVRGFLVPRTERFAGDRLTALATAKGAIERTVPEVLFVCVQNSGRSQMAAALLKAHAGDRVHVRSAGSAPAEQIDPHAVEVMAGRGISLNEEFPKPPHRRRRPSSRRHCHHGLRRLLPVVHRQAVPGLGRRRPGR